MRFFILAIIALAAGCQSVEKPRIVLRSQVFQPDAVNNPKHVTTVSTFQLEW